MEVRGASLTPDMGGRRERSGRRWENSEAHLGHKQHHQRDVGGEDDGKRGEGKGCVLLAGQDHGDGRGDEAQDLGAGRREVSGAAEPGCSAPRRVCAQVPGGLATERDSQHTNCPKAAPPVPPRKAERGATCRPSPELSHPHPQGRPAPLQSTPGGNLDSHSDSRSPVSQTATGPVFRPHPTPPLPPHPSGGCVQAVTRCRVHVRNCKCFTAPTQHPLQLPTDPGPGPHLPGRPLGPCQAPELTATL